jgi:multidrug transporter EmrE-like cation transporter
MLKYSYEYFISNSFLGLAFNLSFFFAVGEYSSKRFAIAPGWLVVLFVLLAYGVSELTWLPAILQKSDLAVTGTIWSVLSLFVTCFLGIVIFKEQLSVMSTVGMVFALIAVTLLSLSA